MAYWIFQANPARYDLIEAVQRGSDDNWAMNQYRDKVTIGDRVFFYLSGRQAGVYVHSRSADHPFGKWGVQIVYERAVEPPILRAELLADVLLRQEQIFTRWQGTNWPLRDESGSRLDVICSNRGHALPLSPRLQPTEADDPFESTRTIPDDPEQRVLQTVRLRRGQPTFRDALVKLYGGRCAVTGHGPLDVLEAAHIEPHSVSGRNSVDNGLLLRSDIHTLFDAGLLWILPDSLEVRVANQLRGSPYEMLNGVQLRARVDGSNPSTDFLRQRSRG